ncbi:FKBP-type peptidyl-prolyl cis-trans isomerase [Bacteroides caecigallinarum]|jgi:FKBP-type peptidyl-prolyl cis-trans isomerase FklB|uniref:FKBP-type peptidyl-prolyl cis-trans isomerase n=1 Tax=Bacteroides TaxID=816 RepID=UPI000821B6E8|nr:MULTISPECIES: FKBP-type peptidyl-prolyl cis-trans isomerase [Bacteroides]MBM6961704.1 FKBP-type peptidyl-prolyl cis-trans isomerase [Bacteroides caecigallinarum]MCF2736315.1 FKBP-type peptidyl-prolyl cis-trans isomerase [Bacteroides caecigallinarum]MCR8892888.1 FKBP-type peptidyl-prolyl cis-trans isomerase [Bacteroides sp. ET336]MCU6770994.1 FKBP-type peptidyl-prolyl cis-trans isomerase [Bacteroides cellulolyticus]MDN0052559.1 FKBP-type peptidyl-prolyl cis-trans isomerase [Bacteroides caeci
MKKSTALMVLAAAAGLASCGQSGTPKANMKSDIDTLSYMVGVSNSQGLKDYVVGRLGVDTTYMADFIKGIKEGMKNTSDKEKAYMAGMQIGQQVSGDMYEAINNQLFAGDSTTTMSKENFLAGFIAAVEENSLVAPDSASMYVRTKSEEIKTKALEAKYGEYKKENEEFLANNKSKDGIKVTESGLQYRIIKEGKGEIPTKTSRVKVHYKGTMIDGTEFDSSYERKEPTTFRADQVIKGWTEALTMMPVGSKWELYIPQELGYGSREAGKIKPFSTLIFEVELISIEK